MRYTLSKPAELDRPQGPRMTCPNELKNKKHCNCTYPGCPRHGLCCDCIAYHRKSGQLPACYFTTEQEKTWDRSISYFVKCNGR